MRNRRKLVIGLGAGALVLPVSSLAQPATRVWRIGFLSPSHVDLVDSDVHYGPFRQGMQALGYVEGRNLLIEWRSAEGKYEHLPGLAAELVQLKVDVIVVSGTTAISAVQKATASIPVVMGSVGDPVGSGFVRSLSRPGGNITGLSNVSVDVSPKHLEMLLGMVPGLSRVAVLLNPGNPGNLANLKSVQAAARSTSASILPVEARTAPDIEKAFSAMSRGKAGAVIVTRDAFFQQQRHQISELAVRNRLPSIGPLGGYAEAGVLMSYGQNQADQFRRAAIYVDKILKGAKPGDLPVEQPTKFELVINAKTAKALGLTIPQSLLISANKVIE